MTDEQFAEIREIRERLRRLEQYAQLATAEDPPPPTFGETIRSAAARTRGQTSIVALPANDNEVMNRLIRGQPAQLDDPQEAPE